MKAALIAFIGLLAFGVVLLALKFSDRKPGPEQTACTADARLCPDGSTVSRIPPNCEFAACPQKSESGQKVLLYYYNPEKDYDESDNIKCSRDGLVGIEREIPASQTPIADTINLLLKGKENLTEDDMREGITTEYPLEGFTLSGVNLLDDGKLRLVFADPQDRTSGGSCRIRVLWSQIEETAKQFPGVESVELVPDYLFQP